LVNNNKLNGVIPSSLSNMTNLRILDLSNNQLVGDIPGSFTKFDKLVNLNLDSNRLSNTKPFNENMFASIKTLSMRGNHFTFDGIETLAKRTSLFFNYSPQKKIPLDFNNNKFSVYAGGTLSNNTYYWYKDGNLVATIQGDSTFAPTETGNYGVKIKNSIATVLTLTTDTLHFEASMANSHKVESENIASYNNMLSVYPNPAKSLVTVTFNLTGNCIVKLMDNSGKMLQTKTINTTKDGNKLQINVSRYAADIYFISITDEQNKTEIVKLNKE
jgi:hypothetical protein